MQGGTRVVVADTVNEAQAVETEPAADASEKRITVRFPGELVESMIRLAREHDRSLSWEIIRAVREYVQREGDPAK
jgi:predicted HicB family RNase H-like nuclease